MAPLTWRNVDAPNFSGSTDSLRLASQLLGNATNGLQSTIMNQQNNVQDANDASAIMDSLKYSNNIDWQGALKNGTALPGVNQDNISPIAAKYLATRSADMLANDGTAQRNVGQGIANNTSQFNLDQSKLGANIKAANLAAQPAANQSITDVKALYDSGDVEGARVKAQADQHLYTAAGYDANTGPGLLSSGLQQLNSSIQSHQNAMGNIEFNRRTDLTNQQRDTLSSVVNDPAVTSVDSAITKLNGIDGLDPSVKASLRDDINKNKDSYFPAPTLVQQVTASQQGVNDTGTQILQKYATTTPRASQNVAQSGVPYIGYDNQQATRSEPLAPNLVKAMDFLPSLGVEMRVFSGGQESNKPGEGTGSVRHNAGEAADVFFYKDGKKLDWSNPSDVPLFQQIVAQAKTNGLTGFGAGDGYMQKGSMHVGFGTPAVWGAGGEGSNAPQWLKDAYNGAPLGKAPANASDMMRNTTVANAASPQVQPTASPANTIQNLITSANNAPIQSPVSQVPDEPVRQPSATDQLNSAVNGNTNSSDNAGAVAKQVAIKGGGTAFQDTDGTLFKRDAQGNTFQVDNSGIPTGTGQYVPQVDRDRNQPTKVAPAQIQQAPVQGPTNPAEQGPVATSIMLQNLQNTGAVDNMFNPLGSSVQQFADRPLKGKDIGTIADDVAKSTGAPKEQAIDAINQIHAATGADIDVAGLAAKQSVTSQELKHSAIANVLGLGIPNAFFASDKYGNATTGRVAPRIDTDAATKLLNNFKTGGSNTPGSVAPGVNNVGAAQAQANQQTIIQQSGQYAQAIAGELTRVKVALAQHPQNEGLQKQAQQLQQALNSIVNNAATAAKSGTLTQYSTNQIGQ